MNFSSEKTKTTCAVTHLHRRLYDFSQQKSEVTNQTNQHLWRHCKEIDHLYDQGLTAKFRDLAKRRQETVKGPFMN